MHMQCLFQHDINNALISPMQRIDCGACGVELLSREVYQLMENWPQGYLEANPWQVTVRCPARLKPVAEIARKWSLLLASVTSQAESYVSLLGTIATNPGSAGKGSTREATRIHSKQRASLNVSLLPFRPSPRLSRTQSLWQQCEARNCLQWFCCAL